MPKRINPQDRWEDDFLVPLPGEPRNIGPLETLFQRLLNRTERLKNRLGAILGLPWDATPPDTLAGLAGRVGTLEANQGGTTLSAHRTAATLDHPDGSVTSQKLANGAVTTPKIADGAVTIPKIANVSTDPTPNTLALRNAQGAVQDGAAMSRYTILRVAGLYLWTGMTDKWLRLASWSGFGGNYRGLFADLNISRVSNSGMSARLRLRIGTDGSGNIASPTITVANDYATVVRNAVFLETGPGTFELWADFPYADLYVTGVVGTEAGSVGLTPYGNVSSLVQDTPPAPVSDRLYLEWATAPIAQTFPGPGYIVAAGRSASSGYIRYDNGIQVCWATITVGSGSWTYPAAFASTPQVQATAQDTAPRLATITSVSTTAAGVLRTDLSGNTQSGTVHLWAIGLWK